WQWPSCNFPKTLSFRLNEGGDDDSIFKTINSVFLPAAAAAEDYSSECCSHLSTTDDDDDGRGGGGLETIIREVRCSERLLYEPGDTNFMVKRGRGDDDHHHQQQQLDDDDDGHGGAVPFKGSVAMSMESEDPYSDFKRSMREVVESHGVREWEKLEELLGWYLRMNGKMNHGFIVGAFVDLLVGLNSDDSSSSSVATTADSSSSSSSTTPSSSSTTPSSSSSS
ncbi:hypothetical protein M569_04311, partial [Genlisea aurea]